jgi:N6-adenosine-specific RNA methylase IME4
VKYRTIVADPPWPFASWPVGRTPLGAEHDGRRSPVPYRTLSVAEIAELSVDKWVRDDAHLYLWTTNRYLRDAFAVADAWGFRFSQLLVWAKTPMGKGPGGAFAQNAEYILFCRHGRLSHREKQDSVWFNWRRTGVHSRKPDAFLDLVERVSPGPYLELFARRKRLGWHAWGDEVDSDVELVA